MIDILMAVYNGEKFLPQQLDSIINQTYNAWHLIVCDDCSNDKSIDIINEYCKKYPNKITLLYNEENMGAKATFFKLMKNSTADYIMFCDQDDIWNNDKLSLTIDCMLKNENGQPLLVHTDMTVVDENGDMIAESFFSFQKLDCKKTALNNLLVQNVVTGCSVMINKPLADIVKIPDCNTLHDWWLALTACVFGRIVFLPKPTLKYRRHTENIRGARNMKDMKYIASRAKNKSDAKQMLQLGYIQAAEFAMVYADRITAKQKEVLLAYSLADKTKIQKLYNIFKYKIWKQGIVRKLGQLFYM